ncbi:MAG: hypothetical protein WD716_01110 [Fimbriimonadaceae bacterium]
MTFSEWVDGLDEVCGAEFAALVRALPDMAFLDAYVHGDSPVDFQQGNAVAVSRRDSFVALRANRTRGGHFPGPKARVGSQVE